MDYVLQGRARIGLITLAEGTEPGTDVSYDLTEGMVGFIPKGWFHYIQNTGTETLRMLVIFNNAAPDDTDITWGFRVTPEALLTQCFGIPFAGMKTDQIWISPPRREDEGR